MNKQMLCGLIGFVVLLTLLIGFGILQIVRIQERPTKLFEAVRAGRVDEVHELLKAGVSVDIRDEDEATPLIIATQLGIGLEMVTTLIDAGADIEPLDSETWTPLMHASGKHSDREVIKALLDAGSDINFQSLWEGRKGWLSFSPLMIAVLESNDLHVIDDLIKAGADVNATFGLGYTVFQLAHSPMVILKLIEAGVNVNVSDDSGFTPLMHYSSWNQGDSKKAVQILIAAGADIEAKDESGKTAIMWWAMNSEQTGGAEALLELGADINARSNDGGTALIYAAQGGYGAEKRVILLLDAGADVQRRDSADKRALDHLLANGFFDGTQAREMLIEVTE